MTREEAIKHLLHDWHINLGCEFAIKPGRLDDFLAAVDVAISALRPVSRERIEKVWRGCSWCNNEGKKPENWECSLLDDNGFSIVVGDEVVWTNAEFCPVCGKPLSDEAVQMMLERWKETLDND